MGIPKFYRYISERWPQINQDLDKVHFPVEFDNLYLDMNSIIHNCTHTDDDTFNRKSEEAMFADIFAYIDHIFTLVRPKKLLFMAIDGVAPRAKMNQQRARRFLTAYNAEKMRLRALESGTELPKEDAFDSNCITPGTEFMAKLSQNLKYFVCKKITEDVDWQACKVILSGHETPGEGEHKIMQYIRTMKAQPDYEPNVRHCLYGLDADLIMLGLSCHEPHFALLREEVTFGKTRKRYATLTDQPFQLLHISLVREYLRLEFRDLEDVMDFEFDLERIIDDFILVAMMVGNDFLPNLPDLVINNGAFPILFDSLKRTLRKCKTYLNDHGDINRDSLQVWLTELQRYEVELFEKGAVDLEWFNKELSWMSEKDRAKFEARGRVLLLPEEKRLAGYVNGLVSRSLASTGTSAGGNSGSGRQSSESSEGPEGKEQKKSAEFSNHSETSVSDSDSDSDSDYSDSSDSSDSSGFPTAPAITADGPAASLVLPASAVEPHLQFLHTVAAKTGLVITELPGQHKYRLTYDPTLPDPEEDSDLETSEPDPVQNAAQARRILRVYLRGTVATREAIAEKKKAYDQKFLSWKQQYYQRKFGFSLQDSTELEDVTTAYLQGVQWVLHYYYQECPSWGWYYPYHYAPRVSDLLRGLSFSGTFAPSEPFQPFEQLMAVLPARSRALLPAAFHDLMTDPQSPIIDFYPNTVDLDYNGKKNEWEAVVLIPFVDADRLRDAVASRISRVSPEEAARNSRAAPRCFIHDPQISRIPKWPGVLFPPLDVLHAREEPLVLPEVSPDHLRYGLMPGAATGVEMLAGFPSFDTLPYSAELRHNGTVVFSRPALEESMVLSIDSSGVPSPSELALKWCGGTVFVKWPFLVEARVVALQDGLLRHSVETVRGTKRSASYPMSDDQRSDFSRAADAIRNTQLKTRAVDIGKVEVLLEVQLLEGVQRDSRGSFRQQFRSETELVPAQIVVDSVVHRDERFVERAPRPVVEEFPLESRVVFLGAMAYGSEAEVVGHDSKGAESRTLELELKVWPEKVAPGIGKARVAWETATTRYLPGPEVARLCRLTPLVLSQLTASYMVEHHGKRISLGLEIKFQGREQKVLGYSRKAERGWQYSGRAVELIQSYCAQFPNLAAGIRRNTASMPKTEDLMPNLNEKQRDEEVAAAQKFLRNFRAGDYEKVNILSDAFSPASYAALEQFLSEYVRRVPPPSVQTVKGVPPAAVLNPAASLWLLGKQSFRLGDRVAYVQESGFVPVFSRGIVAAVKHVGLKVFIDVVFDNEILTGTTFGGKLTTKRGLTLDGAMLLNLSSRQLVFHSAASRERERAAGRVAGPGRGSGVGSGARGGARGGVGSGSGAVPNVWKTDKLLSSLKDSLGLPVKNEEKGKPRAANVAPRAEKPRLEKPKAGPHVAHKSGHKNGPIPTGPKQNTAAVSATSATSKKPRNKSRKGKEKTEGTAAPSAPSATPNTQKSKHAKPTKSAAKLSAPAVEKSYSQTSKNEPAPEQLAKPKAQKTPKTVPAEPNPIDAKQDLLNLLKGPASPGKKENPAASAKADLLGLLKRGAPAPQSHGSAAPPPAAPPAQGMPFPPPQHPGMPGVPGVPYGYPPPPFGVPPHLAGGPGMIPGGAVGPFGQFHGPVPGGAVPSGAVQGNPVPPAPVKKEEARQIMDLLKNKNAA